MTLPVRFLWLFVGLPALVICQQTPIGGGPPGGGITAIAVDPKTPSSVYAGFRGRGVFKSTDGGQNWIPVNSGLPTSQAGPIAIDPANPAIVYVGTSMGVFKSTNGATSWTASSSGLPSSPLSIVSLAIDPANSAILYATFAPGFFSTTGGGGVFKSTNGGQSWAAVNSGLPNWGMKMVVIDPSNTLTLYTFGTTGPGDIATKIFKSTDGGQNWVAMNNGIANPDLSWLAIDPGSPSNLYAEGFFGEFYRTTDGAQTWSVVSKPNFDFGPIAFDPVDKSIYSGSLLSGILKSTDGGKTWSSINGGLMGLATISPIVIDPSNHLVIYIGTPYGIVKSTNGGQSWIPIGNGTTSQTVSSVAIDPTNTAILYANTAYSLYKSADGGQTWSAINYQLSCLAIDPKNTSVLYGCSYDTAANFPKSIVKSTDRGQTWTAINSSAGTLGIEKIAIDPVNSSTIYGWHTGADLSAGASLFKSTDGAQTWNPINFGLPDNNTVYAFIIDPTNPSTLYLDLTAGSAGGFAMGIYKSTDGGQSWSKAGNSPNVWPAPLALDPTNSSNVYAGGSNVIYKSTDSGQTWTSYTSGVPHDFCSSIVVDPANPSTVYASFNSVGSGVFKSTDGGKSWTASNNGLPVLLIDSLTIDKTTNPSTIYAGTEAAGLFKSLDGGRTWQPTGSTLVIPPPSVTSTSNAASNLIGPIAPGEIVVLSGSGIGPSSLVKATVGNNGLYATQVAGTSVQFNGILAPMIYAWAPQVAAVVPYGITGTTAQVTVTYQGQTTAAFSVPVAASAPAIFSLDSTGRGQAAAINQDGFTINTVANPTKIGDIISLYATGEGQTTPSGTDGKPAAIPLPQPNLAVSATVGGQVAQVQYAGGAPGEVAGVMQVNVQIPSGIQTGNAVPVSIQVGTISSQPGVTIAVR